MPSLVSVGNARGLLAAAAAGAGAATPPLLPAAVAPALRELLTRLVSPDADAPPEQCSAPPGPIYGRLNLTLAGGAHERDALLPARSSGAGGGALVLPHLGARVSFSTSSATLSALSAGELRALRNAMGRACADIAGAWGAGVREAVARAVGALRDREGCDVAATGYDEAQAAREAWQEALVKRWQERQGEASRTAPVADDDAPPALAGADEAPTAGADVAPSDEQDDGGAEADVALGADDAVTEEEGALAADEASAADKIVAEEALEADEAVAEEEEDVVEEGEDSEPRRGLSADALPVAVLRDVLVSVLRSDPASLVRTLPADAPDEYDGVPIPHAAASEAYALTIALSDDALPPPRSSGAAPRRASAEVIADTLWGALHGLTTLAATLEPFALEAGAQECPAHVAARRAVLAVLATHVSDTCDAAGAVDAALSVPPLPITLPLVVLDRPWRPWRGLLLDTARHWLPLTSLTAAVDGLAWSKMNVLHWHITGA